MKSEPNSVASHTGRPRSLTGRLTRLSWLLILLWTTCIVGSMLWNSYSESAKVLGIARNSAEVTFENDVLYRKWVAKQGGVYVPVSDSTPPNPYLTVPNRDITTSSGACLTLVNPAYMARQVNQMAESIRGSRGHITSLRPVRPENAPDEWETAALESFESGAAEVSSVEKIADEDHLRLMRPFVAEKACLKCHAAQGYKEGDIRGGISVSVPLAPLQMIERGHLVQTWLAHLGLWVLGVAGIVLGKNHLAKQQEDLCRARDDWERTFDSVPDLIFLLDDQNRILRANRAAAERLGVGPDHCVGLRCYECVHGTDKPPDFCPHQQTLADGLQHGCEVHEDRLGGDYLVSTTPVLDENGRSLGSVHVARDITLRKRAEESLRQAAEELRRSNHDLEQFAYVSSHDLQEPLRMVTGFVQLLQQRYAGKLDPKADEYIGYAVDGAKRMQGLINDLLAYSRVGSRGREPSPTDVGAALRHALGNLRMSIQESGAEIHCGELPTVRADGTQLVQLFQNLIANAIKFRNEAPPQIHITACREADGWRFSVRDNGIGIAPEFHDRIFLIFQRLHTRKQYPGTGIGLAICKKIVDRHGGKIWVESKPGEGTTFHFTIP